MARKPLIEPGSVLPPTDMLSRIVARDRTASGRAPQLAGMPAPPSPTALPESLEEKEGSDGNITSNITAHTRSHTENSAEANTETFADSRIATHTDAKAVRRKQAQSDAKQESREESKAAAAQRAHQLGQSRPIPITLRLPEALNDWLDEYAHSHRKQGIKKQDLIARAVQLLVVELSADDNSPEEREA